MRQMGYHPNAIARSLVRQSSFTIGLMMSRSAEQALLNPFFPEIIRGISTVAREFQYSLLLSTASTLEQEHTECLQMLRARRVDGVILLASRTRDPLVEDLLAEQYAFVVVGRVPGRERVYWVNNDNVAAAREAVNHLILRGHRDIGFVGGPADFVVTQDRLEGYRQALAARGLRFNPQLVQHSDFSRESGYAAARLLLHGAPGRPRPTAIFAMDDVLALGVLQAAHDLGLQVPGDVAVVGFNDIPLAPYLSPPLSSVRIPIYNMGQEAARLLITVLQGGQPSVPQIVLPAELVVRASSGAEVLAAERR